MIRKMKVFDFDFVALQRYVREVPYLRLVFLLTELFRKSGDLCGNDLGVFRASRDYDYAGASLSEELVQSREGESVFVRRNAPRVRENRQKLYPALCKDGGFSDGAGDMGLADYDCGELVGEL